MNQAGKRPGGVTIIAWSWIITGAYMVLSSIMLLMASPFIPQVPFPASALGNAPYGFEFMMTTLRHISIIALVQLMFGVVTLALGAGLLNLRGWARGGVEALCWLSLIFVVASGLYGTFAWSAVARQIAQADPSFEPERYRAVSIVFAFSITFVFGIPFGVMIKYLRGDTVRNALQL